MKRNPSSTPAADASSSQAEGAGQSYDEALNQFIIRELSAGREPSQEQLRAVSNLREMQAMPPFRTGKQLDAYLSAAVPGVKIVPRPMDISEFGYVDEKVPDVMNINPMLAGRKKEVVKLHEQEHLLKNRAVQALPERERIDNDIRFDQLYGDESGRTRREIVSRMVNNRDKIEKFFGMPLGDSYFNKSMVKSQGRNMGALFEEQIATLSALEQVTGKSLTKGLPDLFPDDKAAAIYDAITGLRQTRLDARDLPPYTPQYESTMDWLKKKLRLRAEGSPKEGEVADNIDEQLKRLYRENLAREADTGGFEYWKKEFGPDIDAAERMRFIEGATPEVQRRVQEGDTTLPAFMKVSPEARRALQSQDITTDEYRALADYFGNKWIAGEAEDPASLTRRDYIERPRSGYDLATFLATRSQQHGAQADTRDRLANLLAPYMGEVGTTAGVGDESVDRYIVNPMTGQTEIAKPLGVDNMYRMYRAPHQGTIGDPEKGSRYAVGMDYKVDPVTGRATFVGPYTEFYRDMGHNDWQGPLAILGLGTGAYFGGMPGFIRSAATTALTNKAKGGEVKKSDTLQFIKKSSKRR